MRPKQLGILLLKFLRIPLGRETFSIGISQIF
jgi:hypothetical protein